MKFVLRGHEPRWLAPAAVLVAVLVTVALTAVPIRLAGAAPFSAFERYLVTPLTSVHGVQEVLLTATPLLFTGIAVAIAFRAGYWNIGAEGQFLLGAVGTTWVGTTFTDLPAYAALPLGFLAGAAGGLLWAVVPAWLKRHAGIDEVVTTLLLNPVALLVVQGLLNGPWRNSSSGFTDSDRLGTGYDLPALVPDSRVHWGFAVAVVVIVVAGVVLARTAVGVRIKAAGQAPGAAGFSGVDVGRLQWRCALVSGAVAGLGGASQVMGVQHQLTSGISDGYGYTGVIVATLGGLGALGVVLVALLLGDISVGAQNVSLVLQVPAQLGAMFSALLLLAVLSAMSWRRYRLQWRRGGSR
ncbi:MULTISPECIES: ABC transporter permease [unclassified Nocardioides]|uniref:ABC transporter permease n=1 Tax=unclassified Nocardioides TaxID=2615069 RepID=UPI002665C751|nr:ABC transporter permease [Nocardioides sp. Arc9.136]WKN48014.1 ABC transporter permease [Nocardioides sp. Arc9.136]